MAKAGSNIYRRKDGRYEGRVLCGKTVYQKPHYISVYGRTLKEVKQKMKTAKEQDKMRSEGDRLVADYAAEWMEKMRKRWKPTTYDIYQRLVDRYIVPVLGGYRVEEVDSSVLRAFAEEIPQISGKQLTGPYLKYVCSLARQIMEYALQQNDLPLPPPAVPQLQAKKRNVNLPGEREFEILRNWLVQNLEDETCLGILVAMYTGIRIGELCALQWKNIDVENGYIAISSNLQRVRIYGNESGKDAESPENKDGSETPPEGTADSAKKTQVCTQMPKTLQSIRTVPLPDGLQRILAQRRQPSECYLIPGTRYAWTDVRTLQYRFAGILKKCGLQPFRFHLLRHAFASRCIWQGCDIKSLSEVLGHSSTQITMNIYVHSSMQQKKNMMNLACDLPVPGKG